MTQKQKQKWFNTQKRFIDVVYGQPPAGIKPTWANLAACFLEGNGRTDLLKILVLILPIATGEKHSPKFIEQKNTFDVGVIGGKFLKMSQLYAKVQDEPNFLTSTINYK